jgi:hypothetical protein
MTEEQRTHRAFFLAGRLEHSCLLADVLAAAAAHISLNDGRIVLDGLSAVASDSLYGGRVMLSR